jgi:hypothetical protein
MARKAAPKAPITVETINHADDKRRNIPTAELQSVVSNDQLSPVQVAYRRRNADLDPQLVWRGKDMQDWSDLVVNAPPIYIQEKIHPKALVDDLRRQTQQAEKAGKEQQLDLFADFNGIPEGADKTDFYQHDQNWTNRMILGDSLQVMASLAERDIITRQVAKPNAEATSGSGNNAEDEIGPFNDCGSGELIGSDLFHQSDGLTRTGAGARVAIDLSRRIKVVMVYDGRASGVHHPDQARYGHHSARRISHLEPANIRDLLTKAGIGLSDHLPVASKPGEVVDIARPQIGLKGDEQIVQGNA